MAGETKILAQTTLTAATLTDLLTVTYGGEILTEVMMTNQDTVAVTVRLAIAPSGEADAAKHYVCYDELIGPGRSLSWKPGVSGLKLGSGAVVRGYSSSASVSFNLLGT